jgi:Helix-turn-helix of DDE superfamily endonuclease
LYFLLLKNLPAILIVFSGLLSVKRAVAHNEIETALEVLCSSKLNFQFLEMNFQNERTVRNKVVYPQKSYGGSQPMGLQIRDNRQRKALTGLSQAPFDHLLPFFSDIYEATKQKTYEEGVESGTRTRKPGGGSKGKLPTMADKLQFVLYYYKTYPTFDVLGTHFDMARSKAHANLHTLSPILYDTLVHLDLMPYRELSTPEELKAALHGDDRLLIDATERAYHRSQDDATQREHDSGKKTAYVEKHGDVPA